MMLDDGSFRLFYASEPLICTLMQICCTPLHLFDRRLDRSRLQRLRLPERHRDSTRRDLANRPSRGNTSITFNDPGYRMAEDKRDRYPGMCRGSLVSNEVSPKYELSHGRSLRPIKSSLLEVSSDLSMCASTRRINNYADYVELKSPQTDSLSLTGRALTGAEKRRE
jgi:hypothetical protein